MDTERIAGKGNRKCPACSTENNALAFFCRNCGARLRQGDDGNYRPGDAGSADPRQTLGGAPVPLVPRPDKPREEPTVPEHELVVPQPQPTPQAKPTAPPTGSGSESRKRKLTMVDMNLPSVRAPIAAPGMIPGRRLAGFIVSYSMTEFGRFFPVYEGKWRVGRDSPECDLVLGPGGDPKVSNPHCQLLFRTGRLSLRDLDSSNHTWVDVETAPRERYPDLYQDGSASRLRPGEFEEQQITFVRLDDEKVYLLAGSFFLIGDTVFKVLLI